MRAPEPHPEAQAVLDAVEAADVLPLHQYGPERAREVAAQMGATDGGPAMAAEEDRTVPGPAGDVPVRVYRPEGEGPFPAVVFVHGGGFVLGDLDGSDTVCRHLADGAGAVVVSVDYRLAPEHPFPAAVEDVWAATTWVADHHDAVGADGRLAVAGDSAGATLAAVTALRARDEGGPELDHQALVYPATSPDQDWPSREENAEGYFLESADMAWFGECYLGSEVHARNPYAFPLSACDLSGVAPATVVTAGFDPLRDEGVAYAERLEDAGVPVEHRHYDDAIHGFFSMLAPPADLELGHEAVDAVCGDLRSAFDGA